MIDLTPRFAEYPPTMIAGLAGRFDLSTRSRIPQLWLRFEAFLGKIPGQIGFTTYGCCSNFEPDGSFQYLCGVAVDGTANLPADFTSFQIPARNYAVFSHRGHISGISATWDAIFRQWLPASGCSLEGEPQFEVYTEQFDPHSGTGLVEIWIPVKAGNAA